MIFERLAGAARGKSGADVGADGAAGAGVGALETAADGRAIESFLGE